MDCVKRPNVFLLISLTGVLVTGCTSVDTIRLTSQTFPPKNSIQEVETIDRNPPCPHIALAELSVDDGTGSFDSEQTAILKKAAELGADAVVFHRGTKRIKATPAYAGYGGMYAYPGWGYGPYGMGGYGYGYGGGMPLVNDTTVRSLTGIAIRYKDTDENGPRC
jgi:hypothetical protein